MSRAVYVLGVVCCRSMIMNYCGIEQAKTDKEVETWIKLCGIAKKWAENNRREKMGIMPLSDAANKIVGVRRMVKRYDPNCDFFKCAFYITAVRLRDLRSLGMHERYLCTPGGICDWWHWRMINGVSTWKKNMPRPCSQTFSRFDFSFHCEFQK